MFSPSLITIGLGISHLIPSYKIHFWVSLKKSSSTTVVELALGLLNVEIILSYEGRTESHEQLFFARELGTADEGECGGRWNQLLCYP